MASSRLSPSVPETSSEPQAFVPDFSPHLAVYEIRMDSLRSGAQVLNVSGQMTYEWSRSCEGWITDQEIRNTLEFPGRPAVQSVRDYAAVESADGSSLDFASSEKIDGQVAEEFLGHAQREVDGSLSVKYRRPDGMTLELPADALLPVQHLVAVLRHAKEGKRLLDAVVFDGGDEDGAARISTFIGNDVNVLARLKPSPDIDMTLLNGPARTVQLAFFSLSGTDSHPDAEMTVTLHENGVISNMRTTYRDFSIKYALKKLSALPEKDKACDPHELP